MLVAGDAVVLAAIVPGEAGDGQGVHQALARVGLCYGEPAKNQNYSLENMSTMRRRSSVMLTNIE